MKQWIGKRFGRLRVSSFAGYGANWSLKFRCVCDCGAEKVVYLNNMKRGLTTSCGCYHRERTSALTTTHGQSRIGRWSPEYRAWSCMLMRCENPKVKNYDRYGARGITVCEEWHKFEQFFEDMGQRPSSKHSIDRIDNDGNYEPGNCRWATRKEQARNKSSNTLVRVGDEVMVLAEACERYGISHSRIRGRIKAGWDEERAITTPVRRSTQTKEGK